MRLPVVGLLLAILGTLLSVGGLFAGIVSGLVDDVVGNAVSTVAFYTGLAALLAALAIGVLGVVRPGRKALPIVTIVVAMLPALFFAGLRLISAA